MPINRRSEGWRWRIAGCVAVVLALIIVLQVTVSRSALATGKGASLSADPEVRLKLAMDEIARRPGGTPTSAQIANFVSLAKNAPLLPEPFLVAGLAMADVGRNREAEELLLAARARDPHKPVVRFLLGDFYRKTGRDAAALRELASLMKVQPQRQVALLPYFAQLATEPQHQPALAAMARTDPVFGRTMLSAAVNAGAASSFVISVGDRLPASPDNRAWQDRLVQRAISSGDLAAADQWARRFAHTDHRPLINSSFDDKVWAQPFNWTLSASSDGVAEAEGPNRLSLLNYGRNNSSMASQLLVLPPGSYRLSWRFEGMSNAADAFEWRLTCLVDGTNVAEVSLNASSLTFDAPGICRGFKLELFALAAGDGARRSGTLTDLSLVGVK